MIKNKVAFMVLLILCVGIFMVACKSDDKSNIIESMHEKKDTDSQLKNTSMKDKTNSEKEHVKKYNVDFDFQTKTVKLNSGYEMPIIGLGTWTQKDTSIENSVYHALKNGYRMIDTAKYYGNAKGINAGVIKAIEEGIVSREEIFVTTKIVPYGFDDYESVIKECNEALGLEYIDLMLIHQQGSDEVKLYRAIEKAINNGIVRSLGISNYYTKEDFDRIVENAKIMPSIIQNENHPFYQNKVLQQYVSKYGVIVESYYSFGGRGNTQDLFNHETIMKIAEAHNKTPAQVLLRWQLQAGYIVIPGSSNPKHIAENFDIFDFELSDDEMSKIADMNTDKRYETW